MSAAGQTVTLRRESIFDSSPGMTRFCPSPNAVSRTRTPLTREANSRGSIEADWSEPHMEESRVMWRSMVTAPSAAAANEISRPSS